MSKVVDNLLSQERRLKSVFHTPLPFIVTKEQLDSQLFAYMLKMKGDLDVN